MKDFEKIRTELKLMDTALRKALHVLEESLSEIEKLSPSNENRTKRQNIKSELFQKYYNKIK